MALVALEHRASSCHQHSHLQKKQHNKFLRLKRNVSMKMMNPGNCLLGETLVCFFVWSWMVLLQVMIFLKRPCHSGSNLWRLLGDDILIPRCWAWIPGRYGNGKRGKKTTDHAWKCISLIQYGEFPWFRFGATSLRCYTYKYLKNLLYITIYHVVQNPTTDNCKLEP